ncbi:MAG: hypothetical protein HQ503_18900 [Rhodospirillales bacterium]|nr:hypothetical protein [Rhodospirillales bacterium]
MPNLIAFVVVFFTALGLVGTVNVTVNLGKYFREDFGVELRIAKIIEGGKYVQGSWEFNIPAVQAYLIRRLDVAPESIIFGSSRSMQVAKRHLSGSGRVLNHAVDTAILETYMGLFALYDQRGIYPKTVLLGLDPWIFKIHKWDQSFRPYYKDLIKFSRKINVPILEAGDSGGWAYSDVFSLRRFFASIQSSNDDGCKEIQAAENADTKCAVRRPDMSLIYPETWRNRSPDEVAREVSLGTMRRGRMHGFDGYQEINNSQVSKFQQFLSYMLDRGITVRIFLPPYHPIVTERYKGNKDWNLVEEAEAKIRHIASKLGVSVVGSFDASRSGCGPAEFFDGLHPRPTCIDKIFKLPKSGLEK